jgi:hypothetical protein
MIAPEDSAIDELLCAEGERVPREAANEVSAVQP